MTVAIPPERNGWLRVERALAGGFFVAGHRCDQCGDTNLDAATRECLTCAHPDDPCSRAYLEGLDR